ncbi:hypothetical protein MLD38_034233 [Melastoma candidum]|uniref:Uncharacterized protein n=1 Tax=Melastoma candidum TaxID=119954 RepID=A0ACB9M8Y1_9MYRT|nr:hypothetical protein MLD38_034233 [Melastoma candidum]
MGFGQIVKRKRKGRPRKSDPSRTAPSPPPGSSASVRRSLRRRNVRYSGFIDFDDFVESDEEEDVGAASAPDEEEEEESEMGMVRKRKNTGREDDDGMEEDCVEDEYGGSGKEDGGWKGNPKGHESPPGGPPHSSSNVPLPDRTTLQLILDKLQKKDIYGVYAEPVDPEELPDYHDIIEKPMDFSTVRKKLANGSYVTLSQFESDVFLICTNAMQYNAPDTVYHKQARSIEELGRKKFLKLRIKYERSLKEAKMEQRLENDQESSEKDLRSEEGVKSNLSTKKLVKKPLPRSTQEPVSSDFSGGAMPATTGDLPRNSAANRGGYDERHSINEGLMDGNVASAENFADKAEELSMGRGFSSRLGQKPSVHDENHQATYTMLNQPEVPSNSIFTTFEGEIRELVAVRPQAEYSYARSLARFAGSLGPIAWKVASKRIQQSLPSDCKFGRGWVMEYEPVSNPIIFTPETLWGFPWTAKPLSHNVRPRKEVLPFKVLPSSKTSAREATHPANFHCNSLGSFGPPTMKNHHVPIARSSNQAQPKTKGVKQFELNSLPSMPHDNGVIHVPEKKSSVSTRVAHLKTRESTTVGVNNTRPEIWESVVLRSRETATVSDNAGQVLHFTQLGSNGVPKKVPKRKAPKNGLDSRKTISPCSGVTSKLPVLPFYFPQPDEGLSDPVQIVRMLSEKGLGQQTLSSPVDNQQVMQRTPSIVTDASSNITGSWITIGAGGIKPPKQNLEAQKVQSISPLQCHLSPQQAASIRGSEFLVPSGTQFQAGKNGLPFHGLIQSPSIASNEVRLHPQATFSPRTIPADFSRLQAHSLWRGAATPSPPARPGPKQDTLPPDLNIGFQSSSTPVTQSPGVKVDSQQPDLALQL